MVAATQGALLCTTGQSMLQFVKQLRKTRERRLIALGVQRQRCVFRGNRHAALDKDVAGINSAIDQVPGHTMAGLAIQDCPDWGIQTSVLGQRSIMKIHGTFFAQRQNIRAKDFQIGNAQDPIDGNATKSPAKVSTMCLNHQTAFCGPIGQVRIVGDDGSNAVSLGQKRLCAMLGQAFVADDNTGKLGHWSVHAGLECGIREGSHFANVRIRLRLERCAQVMRNHVADKSMGIVIWLTLDHSAQPPKPRSQAG